MKKISFVILVIIFAFISCQNKNTVSVKTNFESEVEQQQNLIFTFDKDLAFDSLLNNWIDTIEYIKFTPAVKGKYKWNSSKELMFSPLAGFEPSTDYMAEFQDFVTMHSKTGYTVATEKPIVFHTPYFALTTVSGYWAASKKVPGMASLIVTLNFNYKVDPASVKNLAELFVNDKSATFEPATGTVDKNVRLVIENIAKDKVAQLPLKVNVRKGLKSAESSYVTRDDMSVSTSIPSPEKLEIKNVTGEYVGTETVIHVYTTQEVNSEKIHEHINIDPSTKFETEMTENGFLVKGSFSSSQNYSLVIKKQLEGLIGGTMESDYRAQVSFGEMEPSISFTHQNGIYLSSKSSRNIGVRIVNMPKVHVTIYRVYENNILHYMMHGRHTNYGYYGEEGDYMPGTGYNYNTHGIDKYGDPIFEQDYETKNLPVKNGISLLNLSFDDKGNYKGIYLVKVSSTEDQWRQSTKLVSISDIGMIVKKTDDELYVFTNSIKSAQPVSGVKVSLISKNNQNVLSATTNGEGVAIVKGLRQKMSKFDAGMITARIGEDFNYILLSESSVNNSRFDVGGRRAVQSGLMAFIYGDRDLYRPGETIQLNSVVRNEQWDIQKLPVKIKILLPNGKEYKSMRGTLNDQGAIATNVTLPAEAVTGNYVAEIFTANDVLIASKNISVEEFMPDRIDVKLNLSNQDLFPGDSMRVTLNALNMFGPPAARRKYEIRYNLSRKTFRAEKFPGYYFDIITDKKTQLGPEEIIQGKTDDRGTGETVFTASKELIDQGQIGGKVFATVFDETGKPVNRTKSFEIYTQKIFYGIKLQESYVDPGTPVLIPMIAVDKKGKPLSAKGQIQVVRFDWFSSLEHDPNYGNYRWVSKKKEVILLDQTVDITANGYDFRFIPRESGEYEVRLKNPESVRYTAREFYSYGWGYTANTSFEVNTEGEIDIRLDKEKYEPGDDAVIVFTTPFNGKLLVTLEGDNLLEYRYIDTEKKSAMLKIPVSESYMPNIYVTATLFRPLDEGSIPLTVGHGFLPLKVEKKNTRLPVTIECVEKSRSKTKQTITVKTLPKQNIQLTVAVVDEGILSLRNYHTPDPHMFFYQKKALGVDGFDLYPKLLPDMNYSRSSMAGDGAGMGAYDLEKRVNPLTNKRVKLVSMWSGQIQTDRNGVAKFTFDIPQFSGDLRVMACAYNDKSFGSADKHMKVADPIVISPSIPRFMSPRDTLDMPVTVTNTTSKEANATVQLTLKGGLQTTGKQSQTVSIRPNSEQRIQYKVIAGNDIGNGTISVNVNAFAENFTEVTDITVRPFTSLLKISGNGEISGRGDISLKHDFIPVTADASVLISSNPMVQFSKALQYLVGYPYGCIEQTISKAFPQIYFSELAKNMIHPFATDMNPATNVQAAVNKVQSMQRYDGAMQMWPGHSNEVSRWASAYSVHFLVEAKKAGYSVSQDIMDKSMNYISQQVKLHGTEKYYYYENADFSSWKEKIIYAKDNFYALYLMALYGKADISTMNYFKSDLGKVSLDCRYLLACTYLAVGDRKNYDELLPKSFEGEHSRNSFGGSFYSYLRDMAISLNVLIETDPENPQVAVMVRHLSVQMNKKEWKSSQEAAFSFLALGKFMKRLNADEKITATISINGKTISNFNGKEIKLAKNIAGQTLNVSVNGNGKLFYFWEIEGISAKGEYKEEDKYLHVRKSFYNRFGAPVDLHRVKQGDLIVVKLTLNNLEKSLVENVVVTDMLPAGFEIENPRLAENEEMKWIKNQSEPDYFDVRDDRINYFTKADAKPKNLYYMVRAVSTGNYRMGPVSADAMYNGEYHSYNGAGYVRIME